MSNKQNASEHLQTILMIYMRLTEFCCIVVQALLCGHMVSQLLFHAAEVLRSAQVDLPPTALALLQQFCEVVRVGNNLTRHVSCTAVSAVQP